MIEMLLNVVHREQKHVRHLTGFITILNYKPWWQAVRSYWHYMSFVFGDQLAIATLLWVNVDSKSNIS